MPQTDLIEHTISTTDERPVQIRQFRYPEAHRKEIEQQTQELLSNEIIRPSTSPFNSQLWIVPKKTDAFGKKKWTVVVDFRALNTKTP